MRTIDRTRLPGGIGLCFSVYLTLGYTCRETASDALLLWHVWLRHGTGKAEERRGHLYHTLHYIGVTCSFGLWGVGRDGGSRSCRGEAKWVVRVPMVGWASENENTMADPEKHGCGRDETVCGCLAREPSKRCGGRSHRWCSSSEIPLSMFSPPFS